MKKGKWAFILKAISLGLVSPLPWFLGYMTSNYLLNFLTLLIPNALLVNGYGIYSIQIMQFLLGGIFAILLARVLTEFFKEFPKLAYMCFLIGYVLSSIFAAVVAYQLSPSMRSLFHILLYNQSWITCMSLAFLIILLKTSTQ